MAKAQKDQQEQQEQAPKRRIRPIEERIAELQAKAEAQAKREQERTRAQYAVVLEQRDAAKAKLDRIQTRLDELGATLGLESEDGEAEAEGTPEQEPASDEATTEQEPANA